MKIPLPSGNFIYIGKQNHEIKLTKNSADIVRDSNIYAPTLPGTKNLLAQKYPISNLCAVFEVRNIIYTKRGALGANWNVVAQ